MESTLEAGSSVAHYQIISSIGAGGMGQVYKAQDTKLERSVALKVLPPDLVRNDERVRRFVQEAKAASSLNHPNIVTIHEIGQSPVVSSSAATLADSHPIHYIAMELIDGTTVKRKIHDGVTDLRTLLGYLAQAAEGLAKAHAAGIVHRDLKPENIMITRDGFTKVLDFGLAKLSVKKSASDGNTATELRDATRAGTILGTLGYMSPEQVRGEIVDHRSDIFSFGCILYEAATRRRPFDAESDIDVMHKIMHEKPAPVDELNPEAPAELRRMIKRCLSKDPERRYQSMKDLAIELADLVEEFDDLSASAASRTSGSLSQPLIAPRSRRATPLVVAAAVVALAIAGFGIYRWRTHAAPVKPSVNYGTMKIEQLTSTGRAQLASISPDGKYVALVNGDHDSRFTLSVLQAATKATAQVVPPLKTPYPGISFSPDSNYLLYANAEQASGSGYASLYQVPSLGGTPRRLLFDIDTGVTFSPDGKKVAFGRGHPDTGENWLMTANVDGSGEQKLATFKRIIGPITPAWSPDGKTIVTATFQVEGGVGTDLIAVDAATGNRHTIGSRWRVVDSVRWLPDGKTLVLAGAKDNTTRLQVWLQPYPAGDPAPVTNDLNEYSGVSITADASTIAMTRQDRDVDLLSVKPGATSAPAPLVTHSSAAYESISAARDGTLAVTLTRENTFDVAVIDPGSDTPRAITHDGVSGAPVISADGKVIAFDSLRVNRVPHIFVTDGEGAAVRQLTNGNGEFGPSISGDGRTVTYTTTTGRIFQVSASGGAPAAIADSLAYRYGAAALSPDGSLVAYPVWVNGGVRARLFVRIAETATGKVKHELPWNGQEAKWNAAGDALIFRRRTGPDNLYFVPITGGEPKALTAFPDDQILAFDTGADGTLFIARAKIRSDVVTIRDFR